MDAHLPIAERLCHGIVLSAAHSRSNATQTQIVWTADRDDPFVLCKTPVRMCREYLQGFNWVWHAQALEHNYSHLCPVCVSRLLLAYLWVKGCPQCASAYGQENKDAAWERTQQEKICAREQRHQERDHDLDGGAY